VAGAAGWWRGPRRPVPSRVWRLAADAHAAWLLSGGADPGRQPAGNGRLRRLDPQTAAATAATPLPDLVTILAAGPVVGAAPSGWPARPPDSNGATVSCCGSIPPPAG
jgi:hypothetical protein